ncbi:mannan endo-1,4-beta-mannosidase 1-like [Vigna radiata var. radiata]|uniref:mannan endo-1,4-beta-mannosidase n=1 Tax=Vigna radiata var. radiata TaxID=3916 RepID=A0A1S3TMR3_VIGRR|nr:mannan endo-1,4-beta-mannosidase 1-like [Vigna radiata var. radiata]
MSFMMILCISLYVNCIDIPEKRIFAQRPKDFIKRNGTRFFLNGKPHYFNGFNAYWLMTFAADPSTSSKVTAVFQQASQHGLNLARTMAFNDGGYRALQTSPGIYDENVFRALDAVISEAGKYGIRLILSLVNNWKDLGGKNQYVQWAKQRGQNVSTEDDFFSNSMTKQFYKNHVKTVLTRKNTVTGLFYKDDPTIFSWELMNEPRSSDFSGKQVQDWVSEMAAYVKSIDNKHLLQVGLEGFYGNSMPERGLINPDGYHTGTDFISNNLVPEIDFSSIHAYPDEWMARFNQSHQDVFTEKWVSTHIEDAKNVVRKPILLTEFGLNKAFRGYSNGKRDRLYAKVYKWVYGSARQRGACAGSAFWQLFVEGMDNMADGYDIIFQRNPSTAKIIAQQSLRMSRIR